MEEHEHNTWDIKSGLKFPMIIAITALILSLTSGIVNYRQNNLSNLESSLRDTRDQLQLAKNDITDIRMRTMQQLVDADLAVKSQDQLQDDNATLTEKLRESSIRMGELETQIRRMDHKLTRQASALRAAKKKARTAINTRTNNKKFAATQAVVGNRNATSAAANVDVYSSRISTALQNSMLNAIRNKGFKPKLPQLLDSMGLSKNTTVYYYDASFKAVARDLANALRAFKHGDVILRKGVSPHAKNKIIVHLIGQ